MDKSSTKKLRTRASTRYWNPDVLSSLEIQRYESPVGTMVVQSRHRQYQNHIQKDYREGHIPKHGQQMPRIIKVEESSQRAKIDYGSQKYNPPVLDDIPDQLFKFPFERRWFKLYWIHVEWCVSL